MSGGSSMQTKLRFFYKSNYCPFGTLLYNVNEF